MKKEISINGKIKGLKKISKNEKKIILKILEKLVTMSTYSDDNKLKLKLLICYLESTLD